MLKNNPHNENNYGLEEIHSRYQLVPRTLIFIEKENEILTITKNRRNSFGFGKINGVGGHIERGEEPFEAARREIFEETGLEIDELQLAAILFIDIGENPGIQVFLFKGKFKNGELKESEEGHLKWVEMADLLQNKKIVKDLPILLNIIHQHQKDKPPAFVKYLYGENQELRIAY